MTQDQKPLPTVSRESARVLLIDGRDRLLLFRWVDARVDVPHVWITPGGGLRPGEDWLDAARRELWEETGLSDVPLGPCVWMRRAAVRVGDVMQDSIERFYVARVDRAEVDTRGMEAEEAAALERAHWWSAAELAAATDHIFAPRGLPALAAPLIAGELPASPLALGL